MFWSSVLVMVATIVSVIGVNNNSEGRDEKKLNHNHRHKQRDRERRDIIDKDVENYLTKFGYLPQSDLETGMLRTLDQLEDVVRNL